MATRIGEGPGRQNNSYVFFRGGSGCRWYACTGPSQRWGELQARPQYREITAMNEP